MHKSLHMTAIFGFVLAHMCNMSCEEYATCLF